MNKEKALAGRELLRRRIRCTVVKESSYSGFRCVVLGTSRICGSKPYFSENLDEWSKLTTVGDVLKSFTAEELEAAIDAKNQTTED